MVDKVTEPTEIDLLTDIKTKLNSVFFEILTNQLKLANSISAINNLIKNVSDAISIQSSILADLSRTNSILISQLAQINSTSSVLNTSITRLVNLLGRLDIPTENPVFINAQKAIVTTAGTAVQLPPVIIPYDKEVTIMALSANTGTIYVGNSKADAEDTSRSFPLLKSETIEYKIKDLSQLWLNATVSGEGVVWTVEQEEWNEKVIS